MMSCQVDVAQGILQGKLCSYNGKEYYSFEGIPYAKPPIGNLRFQEPQKPEGWSGIRDALKPGNSCIQVKPGTKDYFGSEDCLYLNVYTPSLPEKQLKKLPVLVFIHGGKLLYGRGDYYRPEYLIEQDVIFVTINYRLHSLGFLCLHIPEAAGNMGLKDSVMALEWIKNNISKFNGDDNNIVAFGESAGGAIVTSYLISDMSNGLVHKIISLSGSCLSDLFMIDDDPIFKAKHLGDVLQQTFDDVRSLYEYLIQLPVEELLYATAVVEYSKPGSIFSSYFLPVVEKQFVGVKRYFKECPIVALRENRYKKLPTLFGVNSHEGGYFMRQDKNKNIIHEKDLRYFIPRFLFVQPYSPEALKIANKIRDFYFGGAVIDDTKKLEYIFFLSDVLFNRDILTFLNLTGKHYDGLYLFRLSYISNMNTRKMKLLGIEGTTHGDSIQYFFYNKKKADNANEKDKKIVAILNEALCNFARNGVPTWSDQSLGWEPYTESKRYCMDFNEKQTLLQNFWLDTDRFWLSLGQRSKL